jgi:hypothetical protein
MKKILKVREFADELIRRIENEKGIDCCKEEIKKLALMTKEHLGEKNIEVNWKD